MSIKGCELLLCCQYIEDVEKQLWQQLTFTVWQNGIILCLHWQRIKAGILKAFNNPTEKTADEETKRQVKGASSFHFITHHSEQYCHLVTACVHYYIIF